MRTTNQITLYIATHNKTGLKYFGKTTKYFTNESLQENYHGSGTYWSKHLKKHGDDVTMEIYGIYTLEEVSKVALEFSAYNNIVESNKWANLIPEDGLAGSSIGAKHTSFSKEKMSKLAKGKNKSEAHKKAISKSLSGKKRNPASEETKKKIRESNLGQTRTKKTKENLSLAKQNMSDKEKQKWKQNLSEARKGTTISDETKEKISVSLKGRKKSNTDNYKKPKEVVKCPYCTKTGGIGIMKRWHFGNCKNI